MRTLLAIVAALAILVVACGKAVHQSPRKSVSIFESSFNKLHGEPFTGTPKSRAAVETRWITQKLDQLNDKDERTWEMRYMANSEFYQEGGPIFIFVGGEWAITEGRIKSGHMYDMAKEHHGYLFYTEHRFYGKSMPLSDFSTENLKYLDVRQALADLAHFINVMKETIPGAKSSKVILVGGSYSATMVTWFKKLYPELATGCWASSAPLFAKVDFKEYKEVTGESIRIVGGEACYNRIQNGIAEMEALFKTQRGAEVKAMLQLCGNFDETNDLNLWTLFSEISDIFAGVVQTHDDGRIQGACADIMKGSDDITGVTGFIMKQFGGGNCNDLTYENILQSLKDVTSDGQKIMRQWTYQTCNEYGWYQTSASKNQPFGTKFPVTLYTTMCHDVYDQQFDPEIIANQVAATNDFFGGLQPEVDNVYITHGQLDPWRAMGVQEREQATVIPLYAHCKDFGSISDKDTPQMRESKERIAELVREWVGASQ